MKKYKICVSIALLFANYLPLKASTPEPYALGAQECHKVMLQSVRAGAVTLEPMSTAYVCRMTVGSSSACFAYQGLRKVHAFAVSCAYFNDVATQPKVFSNEVYILGGI